METSKPSSSLTAGSMFFDVGAGAWCEAVVGCPGDGGVLEVLALGPIMVLEFSR